MISLESNSDAMGLAMFILQRLLWNPDIAAEFRHSKVPHLYKDGKSLSPSSAQNPKMIQLFCFADAPHTFPTECTRASFLSAVATLMASRAAGDLFRSGHEGALSSFTLKKLLLLVCFLDKAKASRLIEHDPCLFCVDAEFKVGADISHVDCESTVP